MTKQEVPRVRSLIFELLIEKYPLHDIAMQGKRVVLDDGESDDLIIILVSHGRRQQDA